MVAHLANKQEAELWQKRKNDRQRFSCYDSSILYLHVYICTKTVLH